jgi:hypothetical protein
MAKRYVSNDDMSVRMFRSDILEKFTKVHGPASGRQPTGVGGLTIFADGTKTV